MSFPTPNHDESLITSEHPFIGNFHKTLPHNEFGEVDPAAHRKFKEICLEIEAGAPLSFEDVPQGPLATPDQTQFDTDPDLSGLINSVAKLVNPLASAATEDLGLDPKSLEMLPAPSVQSISTTAEMVELYWMALLRDAPLLAFQSDRDAPNPGCADMSDHDAELGYNVLNRVNEARVAVNRMFDGAVTRDTDTGKLRAPLDMAIGAGGANITLNTLFRSGLHDEEHGPLVSQFFIRPIGYGVQSIDQKEVPYIAKQDFLTTHGDWLLAQNTGKDKYGRDYPNCNNYSDQFHRTANYYPTTDGTPTGPVIKRYISTMRDLARFVNRDALHQAYFNAALFLDSIGAPVDPGNPYRANLYAREGGFGTLGGPDLLTLVSEVASRSLKVVWRQKWLVHRRCRPEVFGGLLQMQHNGYNGTTRAYGLPTSVSGYPNFANALNDTLNQVRAHNSVLNGGGPNADTLFLPMAFSAGSPAHPAYGAGHATVAGACVTVLKAWFDEDATIQSVLNKANNAANIGHVAPKDPQSGDLKIIQPGFRKTGSSLEDFCDPQEYTQTDAAKMTIGGELNKLASNVAMGRSMGGVHWRSDNTRSLRLGEKIAIEILRKRTLEYAEKPVSFTFRSFDRKMIHITKGQAMEI